MENSETKKEGKKGYGKYIAIGCLMAVVILMICGYIAYRGIKGSITSLLEEYTDTESRAFPLPTASENEIRILITRMDEFKRAVIAGEPAEPLILTSDEINQLIYYHPDWSELKGKANIEFEDERIEASISFPLGSFGEFLGFEKDRYLNGSAVFSIELNQGRLLVFLDSVEVRGESLPESFMQRLRSENLAKDAFEDEELALVIEKLESITVENGQLYIVPKKFQ